MASKAKAVDETGLEQTNRKLRAALSDCHKQLERAEKLLASKQDNNSSSA